jgi:hypothetical protein
MTNRQHKIKRNAAASLPSGYAALAFIRAVGSKLKKSLCKN